MGSTEKELLLLNDFAHKKQTGKIAVEQERGNAEIQQWARKTEKGLGKRKFSIQLV